MSENMTPDVTPEKIYPFLRQADQDQLETMYRLSHHLIRGVVPEVLSVSLPDFLALLAEGTNRQRLMIHQVAFHLIHKDRMA